MKPDAFVDDYGRAIVLIEYARHGKLWMPHSVFVSEAPKYQCCSTFDFSWSETRRGLYYHESGSGGVPYINGWPGVGRTVGKVWWDDVAAPELRTGGGEVVRAADLQGMGFELVAKPLVLGGGTERNPFIYGVEGDVVYCTKCRDHLPEDDVCEHVFWCDDCGEWGGDASDKAKCRHRKARP